MIFNHYYITNVNDFFLFFRFVFFYKRKGKGLKELILIFVCAHFWNKMEKCQFWKSLKYFSILKSMKNDTRFEYVPWLKKNISFGKNIYNVIFQYVPCYYCRKSFELKKFLMILRFIEILELKFCIWRAIIGCCPTESTSENWIFSLQTVQSTG